MATGTLIWAAILAAGVIAYTLDSATGSFFRCFFFHACSGMLALAGLWALGGLIPIGLALTPFSIVAATALGIPGVLAMLLAAII